MRTIGVMGRLLGQADGLGVYGGHLLQHLIAIDSGSRYVIFLASQVPRAARRLGVDLLFNPKFSLPLLSRIPGMFVLQSCDWYENPGNYPGWDNIYIRAMLPLYCRKARAVLAISQAALDSLIRHGLRPPRALVTHAGVGPRFTPEADPQELRQFRADYQLPERFILTVTRVLHTGPGHCPEYPGGNNERLHAAYQLADCFVLATLCESFGLPILEALATGCPAIVPKTGAGPEVAGTAARLIDPRSEEDLTRALLEVTGSPSRRQEMRAAGLEQARRFGWQQAARRVLEVFEAVLAASPSEATAAAARR